MECRCKTKATQAKSTAAEKLVTRRTVEENVHRMDHPRKGKYVRSPGQSIGRVKNERMGVENMRVWDG